MGSGKGSEALNGDFTASVSSVDGQGPGGIYISDNHASCALLLCDSIHRQGESRQISADLRTHVASCFDERAEVGRQKSPLNHQRASMQERSVCSATES